MANSSGNTPENRQRRAQRLHEIEQLLGQGVSSKTIQLKAESQWGCSDRLVRRDILEIQEKWAAEAEEENKPAFRRSQCRQMLHAIYAKAMKTNALGPAVAVVGRLMELDGLRQLKVEQKVEAVNRIEQMTSDEKRKKIAEFLTVIQDRKGAQPSGEEAN